jgi:hypothetical protein
MRKAGAKVRVGRWGIGGYELSFPFQGPDRTWRQSEMKKQRKYLAESSPYESLFAWMDNVGFPWRERSRMKKTFFRFQQDVWGG